MHLVWPKRGGRGTKGSGVYGRGQAASKCATIPPKLGPTRHKAARGMTRRKGGKGSSTDGDTAWTDERSSKERGFDGFKETNKERTSEGKGRSNTEKSKYGEGLARYSRGSDGA